MKFMTIPTISNLTFGGNSIKLTKNSPTTILYKVSAPTKSALILGLKSYRQERKAEIRSELITLTIKTKIKRKD